jgi:D-alanyl-D-alanine carboxypeptidase
MRRVLVVALVVAVALGAVAIVVAVRGGEPEPSLAAAADELVAKGVPGVLVRLHDGDDVDELARGAASPRDRFRVGSVTKTFVAVLALALADRGVLSLDDPVSRYVPGLLRDGDRVTVRQLLDHTAGLYDYTVDRELLGGDLAPRRLVAIADRRPRSRGYAYSSTNYLALGLVLEAAAGRPLRELLRREVFEPYGLDDTTFEPGRVPGDYLHGNARASRDGVATGQLRDTGSRTARSAWAAAAAVSTASDLDRFFKRLLDSDLGRRMRPPDGARYGLGLARFQTDCGPVVGHTGNLLGTVTVVGVRGDRLLVAAVNVYPLEPPQEAALQRLLVRGLCG